MQLTGELDDIKVWDLLICWCWGFFSHDFSIYRALWCVWCRKRGQNPVLKTEFTVEFWRGMCQSLDELIKSSSLHLNQISIWSSICKYYATKSRYEWMEQMRVLFTSVTYTARVMLVCRLNEDVNIWTISPELFWESLHQHLSKTSLISYTHRTIHGHPSK